MLRQNRRWLTLVLCESNRRGQLSGASKSAIAAARQLNEPIHALLPTGTQPSPELKVPKVEQFLVAQHDRFKNPIPTDVAQLVSQAMQKTQYNTVMAPHSVFCKDVMPVVAGLRQLSMISDAIAVKDGVWTRPIYAGNALCQVKSTEKTVLVTVRPTSFAPADDETSAKVTGLKFDTAFPAFDKVNFVRSELVKSDRPELGAAKVIVSGGRGLKNGDNFKLLYALADKLNAAGTPPL